MSRWVCTYCGKSVTSGGSPSNTSGCPKNSGGHHYVRDEIGSSPRTWRCSYCGHTATSSTRPSAGNCSKSPRKTHDWN